MKQTQGPGQSGKLPCPSPPAAVPSGKVEFIWAQSQAIQDHVPKTAVPAPEPRRLAVIHRRPHLSGRTKGRGSLGAEPWEADGHKLHWRIAGSCPCQGRPAMPGGFHEPTPPIDSPEERAPSSMLKPSPATFGS
ncbi:hypothetical protein GGI35DRAFT_427672 [Trichoderma velutinum]